MNAPHGAPLSGFRYARVVKNQDSGAGDQEKMAAQLGGGTGPARPGDFSYAPGVGEILLSSLAMALGVLVPAGIVRWDLRRLRGENLARSWPDASLWSAVVVFGFLCVPVHFIRTRRSWGGLGLAALGLAGALFLIVFPTWALGRIFGVDD